MPLSKIHNTLTSDHILLDGTDSTGANANSNVILDSSAANTDVGSLMSYEAGADDGSVMLTNTHLADITSPVRSAGRTITLPDVSEPILTDDDPHFQVFRLTGASAQATGAATELIDSPWEEVETTDPRGQFGKGSIVSQSSGAFSFSKTGYYKVTFTGYVTDNADNQYAGVYVNGAAAGGNTFANLYTNIRSTRPYANLTTFAVVPVQTKLEQVKFFQQMEQATAQFHGDGNQNTTVVTFQRIGDI
tara:strand:- start:799 stop:1539 length:741 start_codon:yes stop_codon:yes gene_type:complete